MDPTQGPIQSLAGLPVGLQADAVATPETSIGQALRSLASRADIVFVGQVQRIDRGSGVVSVLFSVDRPILGDVAGSYTLREWSGLWTGGRQRYIIGQRAMVFLHAGAGGLGSPVDGMDGVVPVVVQGADADPLVDVRWLAARTQRPVGAALPDAEAMTLQAASAVVQSWKQPELAEPIHTSLPIGVRPLPIDARPIAARPIDARPIDGRPISTAAGLAELLQEKAK